MGLLEDPHLLAEAGRARLLVVERLCRDGLYHPDPLGKWKVRPALWRATATVRNPPWPFHRERRADGRAFPPCRPPRAWKRRRPWDARNGNGKIGRASGRER